MAVKIYPRDNSVNQGNGIFKKYRLQLEAADTVKRVNAILKSAEACIKLSNDELMKLSDISLIKKEVLR